MKHEGLRFNKGKLKTSLTDTEANNRMIEVFEIGAEKYGVGNWQKGMSWKTVLESLERHLIAIKLGEDFDKETGKLHSAHIQCNAHMLTYFHTMYRKGDDRYINKFNSPKIGLDVDGVIGDFVSHMFSYLKLPNYNPTHWNDHRILDNFHVIENDFEFWNTLPVIEIPNFEPVTYVTARPIDQSWTELWLRKNNLPIAPLHTVKKTSNKLEVLLQYDLDCFVEDNYDTFVTLNNGGVKTYLRSQSYNLKYNVGQLRIDSLEQLVNLYS